MRTLTDYTTYLREKRLHDLAVYYLKVLKEYEIPLIKTVIERGLFKELSDEETVKNSLNKFLLSLEDNTAIQMATDGMKTWEDDKLPVGINKKDIQASDLILVYTVQKRTIYHFLPEYTSDAAEILNIVQELDDYYAQIQDNAIRTLLKIQLNAEGELKRAEEQFARMVHNVKDYAIFLMDATGHIQTWNEGAERIKGYKAEEVIGKHISIFYTEEDKKNKVPEYNLEMAKKLGHYECEGYRVKKDGTLLWATLTYTPVYDDGGNLVGYSKVIRDLTKQRKSSEELLAVNNFLDSVLENIPNMIFVKDAQDLRFIRFNKAGEKLLGLTKTELMGKNDYDFFPKEQADFFTGKDRDVLSQVDIIDIPEEPIHAKTGKKWLHTKKIPILGPNNQPAYLLGISEDITEIREAKHELENKTLELQRSNSELEQFAYVASHDLQEPLRTVSSYVQLLAERYKDKLDQDANEFIDFAVDGSSRMRLLINSLLEYSRINRIKPFEWIDTKAIVSSILIDMSELISTSGAVIKVGELPNIFGDTVLIGQLFQNLIANAIKFKDDKKPEIEIACERKKGEYLFSVKDNGIGIKNEYAEKIFVIFQRLNSRNKYPGTGIGLSICKKIVERHGGKIWVESTLGNGATFYFTIKTNE